MCGGIVIDSATDVDVNEILSDDQAGVLSQQQNIGWVSNRPWGSA
jgi:hypothetical protein